MKLFTIDENYMVELNKPWILLIPEFAVLLKRDKGTKQTKWGQEGDYRGDKKLKARREFSFIYFDLDFSSPIREWEDIERRAEAMRYASLTEADLDGPVMDAHTHYNRMLLKGSRRLRTLRALEKGMDSLDKHFESIDFTLTDKKGELLHDPQKFIRNMELIDKGYISLKSLENRVMEELKGEEGIRGKATLGMNEGKKRAWSEAARPLELEQGDEDGVLPEQTQGAPDFRDLSTIIHHQLPDNVIQEE